VNVPFKVSALKSERFLSSASCTCVVSATSKEHALWLQSSHLSLDMIVVAKSVATVSVVLWLQSHCVVTALALWLQLQNLSLDMIVVAKSVATFFVSCDVPVTVVAQFVPSFRGACVVTAVANQTLLHHTAQGWNNRTLISHEPLVCSKKCFSKTKPVQ